MKKYILFISFLWFSMFVFGQQNQFIVAENYFRNNEYEKAIQLYKSLYDKSPYNTTYLERLVKCYQETNQFHIVENLINSRLKQQPDLGYLNVILGQNYERQQNQELANVEYEKAINSINKQPSFGGIIANFFRSYSKLNLAIKAYELTMQKNNGANYGFQLAQIYGEQGEFDKMFASYVDMVDKNENYLSTVKRFTSRYITDDSENENNVSFKRALLRKSNSNPKDIWNNLLAWLFIKQKEYNKALIQHKALLARDADNLSGIKELGKIAFENEDYQVAKECFDMVIERTNYPRDKFFALNRKLLIAVKEESADTEEQFLNALKDYGVNSNTVPIQVSYANYVLFKEKNPRKAIEILEEAKKFANSPYLKVLVKLKLGEALVFAEKFNKALIYFAQVQTKHKNSRLGQEARYRGAQTSYFKGDFKWAKAQLKVLKGSTSQLTANDAAYLFLVISDNEPKDSISTGLKEYAKADLLAYQQKNDEAITVIEDVIANYKGQSIEDDMLFKQATLYERKKMYDEALLVYAKVLAVDEKGILVDDVYYKVAELYNNKLNNTEKAKEYYQKIIFDHPNSIYLVDARKKYRKLRGDNI
ncbi:hypothetical protein WH52_04430 [Tenacibaculum holothuriorum]|uniref:Tetratricopeptide repeat protein n=1 Tax=Tenacibaculum holothuriorum TaxID=1635173 RepID=A0A1Y2PEJ3_9FLAO|nr:tetratricopeptide repeat protein [Tenacibaculum holothuriorum]OSY88916.1 hypothetical protein WH52_04430 [Tenacibaculum holothuriorum]